MVHRSRFLLLAFLLPEVTTSQPEEEETKSEWYSRYPSYPQYCSTPEQMMVRGIPPLELDYETKVVHVTSILRHGARTVLGRSPDNQCWDGYWDDPETGVWNCELTELLAPPNPERIMEEEEEAAVFTQKSMFLFDKTYDALHDGDSNILNGTCQEGQMILEGYEQLLSNGEVLREAYLYKEGSYEHDERMRLFDISPSSELQPWDGHNLYLRSDDSQQTLMSGQLLLRGMFENELKASRRDDAYGDKSFPTIPVHTADHSRDILGGFQEHCPKLDAIQAASETSKDYLEFYNSEESQQVRDFMESQLVHDPGLFDCLMTTVCTDRPLPDSFGVYNPNPSSWFNRIAAYHSTNHSFHLRYDDAEYSKLSMGPLWAEILDHITPVLNGEEDKEDRVRPPAKLAVYSGYDSTIMQLLSTLGPNVWNGTEWPPYASMMLIEIHELVDGSDLEYFQTNFGFRLMYNGQVLTSQVEGCPPDAALCDAKNLIARIQTFANRSVDCVDPDAGKTHVHAMKVVKSLLTTTGGILLAIAVAALSAMLGAVGVFFYLTGTLPTKHMVKKSTEFGDESSAGGRSSVVSENVEMSLSDASPYDANEEDYK